VHQTLGQQVPQHDMSSAQRTVIERASLPTKDFTNGLETNVRRTKVGVLRDSHNLFFNTVWDF
jgi:hypothetical protein